MDKELYKITRHAHYLDECDAANGLLRYSTEDELYKMRPQGIWDYQTERQEEEYHLLLYRAMNLALDDLKRLNPYWHQVVCDFYLRKEKITLNQLGTMHGKSRQAITKTLKRAMKVLQQIADEHLDNLMNE